MHARLDCLAPGFAWVLGPRTLPWTATSPHSHHFHRRQPACIYMCMYCGCTYGIGVHTCIRSVQRHHSLPPPSPGGSGRPALLHYESCTPECTHRHTETQTTQTHRHTDLPVGKAAEILPPLGRATRWCRVGTRRHSGCCQDSACRLVCHHLCVCACVPSPCKR